MSDVNPRVSRYVIVADGNGNVTQLKPGDDVPEWASITNPKALESPESSDTGVTAEDESSQEEGDDDGVQDQKEEDKEQAQGDKKVLTSKSKAHSEQKKTPTFKP